MVKRHKQTFHIRGQMTNKHMERYHEPLQKCKLKPQSVVMTDLSEWLKKVTPPNASKDAGN